MSLGLYENRQRQRAKRRWATVRFIFVLIVIGVTAVVSYDLGARKGGEQVEELTAAVDTLEGEANALREDAENAATRAERANEEAQRWEERYREEVPEGFYEDMLSALREKTAAGVSEDRLAFLVSTAQNVETCDEGAETKRFLVRTLLTQGQNDSVAFGEGTLTVTASGESALAASGAPEAWFDPDKEITLTVTTLGGEESAIQGLLPLHHTVIEGGREYRFSARAGSRGFLEVTGTSCAFP